MANGHIINCFLPKITFIWDAREHTNLGDFRKVMAISLSNFVAKYINGENQDLDPNEIINTISAF